MDQQQRLATANAALQCFVPDTRLELRNGRVFVCWENYRGKPASRMWMTRGGSFYPMWSHKWAHGGTCTIAMAQLVRWVRGLTVLPMTTWEYWVGERVGLAGWRGKDKQEELLATLRNAGYPLVSTCIFCGKSPIGRFDWYSYRGKEGTVCLPMCEAKHRFDEEERGK